LIAEGMADVEGLALADLDGDGRLELIAGPNIFAWDPQRRSLAKVCSFAPGYRQTRVAAADLDGDGSPEIVLCEGESHPGRLAICSPPNWEPLVLRADLFHPHSLDIGDLDGDGRPDIFVAEMGLGRNPDPRMLAYLNRGGSFEEALIQHGIPTHEAKLADLNGDGRPDIIGKPYDPERHIDIWLNET